MSRDLFNSSPFENYAEVCIGASLAVWLAGNYARAIFSCCDKSEPSPIYPADYFSTKSCCSGMGFNSYVLLKNYPIFTIVLFMVFPAIILVTTTLLESDFLHDGSEALPVGHSVAEAFLFTSIYFITLASVTFSFPMLQNIVFNYVDERNHMKWYARFPIQYQDRIYTACGLTAYSSFNTFLLLAKINSSEAMNRSEVDRLLFADILLPWALLIRGQPFIKGMYFFLPAFEFNEAYGGLILFGILQFGFLAAAICLIGSVIPLALYIMEAFYFVFLVIPKLSFFYGTKLVQVNQGDAEGSKVKQLVAPVRKALFDGADNAMKTVNVEDGSIDAPPCSKTYLWSWHGRFPTALPAYMYRPAQEDDLTGDMLVIRRLKRFDGMFALPSVLALYALGLPLLIFFRTTSIKYYKQMNVLPELPQNTEFKVSISRGLGRSITDEITLKRKMIFIVDSPGMEASLSYFFYLFYYNKKTKQSTQRTEIKSFFLWQCSSFMNIMTVVKFLKSFMEAHKEDAIEYLKHVNFLITCQLTPYKFWAIRDYVDGTEQEFIKNKMLIGKTPPVESLIETNLFPKENEDVEKVNGEDDEKAVLKDVDTAQVGTGVASIGSSALTAAARTLVPRLGDVFYDVIFEHSMTERNAWDPNGFFQVG